MEVTVLTVLREEHVCLNMLSENGYLQNLMVQHQFPNFFQLK